MRHLTRIVGVPLGVNILGLLELFAWIGSMVGIGSLRVSDIDMTAPDVERFHLGDIYLNDFSSDGLGEFVAEGRPVRRRPEAALGIDRQGRQPFARLIRAADEVAHLADDPCAQGD